MPKMTKQAGGQLVMGFMCFSGSAVANAAFLDKNSNFSLVAGTIP